MATNNAGQNCETTEKQGNKQQATACGGDAESLIWLNPQVARHDVPAAPPATRPSSSPRCPCTACNDCQLGTQSPSHSQRSGPSHRALQVWRQAAMTRPNSKLSAKRVSHTTFSRRSSSRRSAMIAMLKLGGLNQIELLWEARFPGPA